MRIRNSILAFALMLPLMAAIPAAASIPEDSNTGSDSIDGEDIASARQLFVTRKCQVRGVKKDRVVLLYDELGRTTHEIKLSDKVKLRAVSKKQFGRKKLAFEDFAEGQRVKVNIRKSDGRILRIDILPDTR